MTYTTLKICYQIWKVPFCPFHRRKTKGNKKIKLWPIIKKVVSHLLQPPCLSLLLIQWRGWCCINDGWALQAVSYSWLRASAFNKCLLRTYVTFGNLHLSPPVKMASCLLMNAVQLLGHGGNQPLWLCKRHFLAEHLPLLPGAWCTWLPALGSNQPPDFQMTPAPDSWLGCLRGHDGRSELALSEGDALAWQPPWPQGLCKRQLQRVLAPSQRESVTKLRPCL